MTSPEYDKFQDEVKRRKDFVFRQAKKFPRSLGRSYLMRMLA